MATPASGVFTLPVAARRRPIQDALDPPSDAACGFRFCVPNRLEDFHYQRDIDRLHWQIADDGIDVSRERRRPLRGVFRVFPASAVRPDKGLGALPKGHCPGNLELRLASLRSFRLDRIDAVQPLLAGGQRLVPSLGQGHGMQRAEPHIAQHGPHPISERPRFHPGARIHLEIQAAAVAMHPRPRPGNVQRGEPTGSAAPPLRFAHVHFGLRLFRLTDCYIVCSIFIRRARANFGEPIRTGLTISL
jgi:hypothetical protein